MATNEPCNFTLEYVFGFLYAIFLMKKCVEIVHIIKYVATIPHNKSVSLLFWKTR